MGLERIKSGGKRAPGKLNSPTAFSPAEKAARTQEAGVRAGASGANAVWKAAPSGEAWTRATAGQTKIPGAAERTARVQEAGVRAGVSGSNAAAPSVTGSTGEAWTRAAPSQTRVPAPKAASADDIWARGSRYSGIGSNPVAVPSRPASYQTGKDDYRDTWAQGLTGTERRERKEDVHRQLAELAGQAQADLDTDALNSINRRRKELRASIGEQTFGDRVNDTLSGVFSGYAGALTNLVGTVAQAANSTVNKRRQIDELQKQLDAGGYSYGGRFYPLTDAGRKSIQDTMRRLADEAWRTEHNNNSFADRAQRAADRMSDDSAKSIASAKEGLGAAGQLAVDLGVAGGQMGLDALASAIIPGAGGVLAAARSAGSSAREARLAGADLDQQLLAGAGAAVITYGTERLSNLSKPFQKIYGKGAAETIAGRLAGKFGESTAMQMLTRFSSSAGGRIFLSGLGEAAEENVEGFLQAAWDRFVYDPDAKYTLEEAKQDALVAGILGAFGGGVDVAASKSGYNLIEVLPEAEMQTRAGVDTLSENAAYDIIELERMVTEFGAREETRETFLRRAVDDGYTVYEGATAVYGYRRYVQREHRSGSREETSQAVQTQRELRHLGIDAYIIDGEILYNRAGITQTKAVPQAVTVENSRVFICKNADLSPRNIAGHEAFHLWKRIADRDIYIEVLEDNLLFSSETFRNYQSTVAQAYFNSEADLSNTAQVQKLREEFFAYISGDIHEGTHDISLRKMLRDYGAVKAAWEELVSSAKAGMEGQKAADTKHPHGGDGLLQIQSLSRDPFLEGFSGEDRDTPDSAEKAEYIETAMQEREAERLAAYLRQLYKLNLEDQLANLRAAYEQNVLPLQSYDDPLAREYFFQMGQAGKNDEESFQALYEEYMRRMIGKDEQFYGR